MKRCELVFLVPGFLGFDRFDDYAYFADRMAVALRAAMFPRLRPDAPELRILAIPTPPTAGLATRQWALARTLVKRAQAVAQSGRLEISGIHLVGHSAGGVDSHLLTLERPLAPHVHWQDFDGCDVTWLRTRLRSVVSIASPHQGTCLSVDPLARLLASGDPLHLLGRVPSALKEILQLMAALPSLVSDADLPDFLASVLNSHAGQQFLGALWKSRNLINDLTPEAMRDRYSQQGAALPLLRRSFVTVAGVTSTLRQTALQSLHSRRASLHKPDRASRSLAGEDVGTPPDALFLLLSSLASGRNSQCNERDPVLPGSLERLEQALSDPRRAIAAAPELLPERVDQLMNDGVVNSARQLINPQDPDELAAIVVGDHFDVLGHYDRTAWVTDPKTGEEKEETIVSGLLHSGSEFRDTQFFALMDQVSALLAALVR
jgi:hypothetical protein